MKKRPEKHPSPLARARELLTAGQYLFRTHALDRMKERRITIPEVKHIIVQGYHEKSKDDFDEDLKAWKYAIRGKTVDKRNLRMAIALDRDTLLVVVTAIDLDT